MLRSPKDTVTASNESSANGRWNASAATFGHLAVRAAAQHAEREVGGHAPGAGAGVLDGRHRGAGGEVEDPLAGSRLQDTAGQPAPAAVEAQRHHRVRAVVALGDAVEHLGHVAGVLVQAGPRHAQTLRLCRAARSAASPLALTRPARRCRPGRSDRSARRRPPATSGPAPTPARRRRGGGAARGAAAAPQWTPARRRTPSSSYGSTRNPVRPCSTRSRGPPASGAMHRHAGGQRLLHRLAERLVRTGVDEDVEARVGGGELEAGAEAEEGRVRQRLAQRRLLGPVADDHDAHAGHARPARRAAPPASPARAGRRSRRAARRAAPAASAAAGRPATARTARCRRRGPSGARGARRARSASATEASEGASVRSARLCSRRIHRQAARAPCLSPYAAANPATSVW